MTDRDTTAVLAHHVRRLDPGSRAALVADLWTARGFDTEVEGRDVVATRGATERVRVGASGVTADAAGVRVVDPEGLARMLRYAVDRGTARTLCERHLGAPPGELRPPVRERLRTRLGVLRTAASGLEPADPTVAPASVIGAVLALLVVGAVAGVALTGTPGATSAGAAGGDVDPPSVPESTPVGDRVFDTRTPTGGAGGTDAAAGTAPPNASVVPGLSDERVVDLSALAAAHARALLGRSYTLWIDTYRPPRGDPDAPITQFDTDVAVADDRFLVEENVGDDEDRRRLRSVYYDGGTWYVANETDEGATYTRVRIRGGAPRPALNPDNVALGLVADYLSTPETTVEGRSAGGGGGSTLYRVVGHGTPPTMADDGVRNYTAVALVDRDGLVRDLTVTYTVTDDDGAYEVRREWTYGYLGETTVDPPPWYVERFAGDAGGP